MYQRSYPLFRMFGTAMAGFFLSLLFMVFLGALFLGVLPPNNVPDNLDTALSALGIAAVVPGLPAFLGAFFASRSHWAWRGRWACPLPWLLWFGTMFLFSDPGRGMTGWINVMSLLVTPLAAYLGGSLGDAKRRSWDRMNENLHDRVEHILHGGDSLPDPKAWTERELPPGPSSPKDTGSP